MLRSNSIGQYVPSQRLFVLFACESEVGEVDLLQWQQVTVNGGMGSGGRQK